MEQQPLRCVACIVEAKLTLMNDPEATPPRVRRAVAILNAQTTCAEHIVVQQQSQLAAPNGSPLMIPGR